MTFIYYCVNDNGIKTNFRSTALLSIGMRIPEGAGFTTIVNMDAEREISVYDDAIDFGLEM